MNKTPFVFDPTVPLSDAPTDLTRPKPLQNATAIQSKAERTESLEGYSVDELRLALENGPELSRAAQAHIFAWIENADPGSVADLHDAEHTVLEDLGI